MMDMRYHVISLVAVFLALAIGILLGTTLVEKGLIAEQKSEISKLKKTFEEIKGRNDELNDSLVDYQRFADEAKPYLVANRLTDRPFALLIQEGTSDELIESARRGIESGGGRVQAIITINGPKAFKDQKTKAFLAQKYGVPPEETAVANAAYGDLANQLATYTNPASIKELTDLKVIDVSGSVPGPLSGAALLPNDAKPSQTIQVLDVPLIKAFKAVNYNLVGIGGRKTKDSTLTVYKENGLSTVDHVETSPGQVAYVMVLGGAKGSYGIGPTADRVIPEGM